MKYFFSLIYLLLTIYSCTPFDSNVYNKKMIGASWIQVEISYPNQKGDSIYTEQTRNNTILTFTADSCHEEMTDLQTTTNYSYDIKDYVLKLEKEGTTTNYLTIQKLTKDSLILSTNNRLWRYIKKQTE